MILAIGMLIGYNINFKHSTPLISSINENSTGKVGRVEEVIRFIESKYLYKTNQDNLIEKALQSVTSELDPFSLYIPPDKTADINNKLNGVYTGIGIESYILNDTLYVIRVMEDGPAMKAGIHSLDKIIQVGNYNLTGDSIDYSKVRKIISSFGSSPFDVVVQDANNVKKIMTIKTQKLDNKSLKSFYYSSDSILYTRIEHFSNHTYREFMQILEKNAINDKIKNLIIDVRDNPGGYLEEVTKILDQLFDRSKLDLVTTVYHDGRKDVIKSSGRNFYAIDKVIVLINENSASGSEVLAGVLQDYDRAVIIGKPSFGKGLVQEQFNMGNGGALRLTIANYYLPTGRSIQKELDLDTNYVNSLSSHYEKKDTFYSFYENRPLMSGGGIYPDYEVNDSLFQNFKSIYYKFDSVLMKIAVNYISQNKDLLKMPLNEFVENYKLNFNQIFLNWENNDSLPENDLKNILFKAKIAYILYGADAEQRILNQIDPNIEKAFEIIKKHQD